LVGDCQIGRAILLEPCTESGAGVNLTLLGKRLPITSTEVLIPYDRSLDLIAGLITFAIVVSVLDEFEFSDRITHRIQDPSASMLKTIFLVRYLSADTFTTDDQK